MYLPRFANPKMERKWCMPNLPWKSVSEDFGVEEDRRQSEEDGDYCSSLLCCFFFFGPRRWNLSLAYSPWSLLRSFSTTGHHAAGNIFCSLIFKHRDGEFCFSVLVLYGFGMATLWSCEHWLRIFCQGKNSKGWWIVLLPYLCYRSLFLHLYFLVGFYIKCNKAFVFVHGDRNTWFPWRHSCLWCFDLENSLFVF